MAGWVRRLVVGASASVALVVVAPAVALACGGIVAPGNAGVLRKATTLAAWHAGYEHYVTGFQFAAGADRFGYIIPLPGVPTKIEKAGRWTLERLELEIASRRLAELGDSLAVPAAAAVEVLQRVRVDALDITVVRGGGSEVAAWAKDNGFDLTPDTPTVLGRYAADGAVFALAKFDVAAAAQRGLVEGQGTIIHFTIPTPAPWIPLRILALGKPSSEVVEADLFILTDHIPNLDPVVGDYPGMSVVADRPAGGSLLADIRSDRGMSWLPASGMWLTALSMRTPAKDIRADLSIDGGGLPLTAASPRFEAPSPFGWWVVGAALVALVVVAAVGGRRPPHPA